MMLYNFDELIDRHGIYATKYGELEEKYGRSDLFPLWIADMDFATPKEITDALHRCINTRVLGYTTPEEDFWESIAGWLRRRHGWELANSDIDFLPGVKKGLGLAINYFTSPGDKIVIQPPVYHSFRSVVAGNGREVVTNPLIEEGGHYRMDLEGLETILREEQPRMLIICNPHNPIGIQWSKDCLQRVAALCKEYNTILLSDEIYGDMVLDGKVHIPTAMVSDEAADVTVTLGAPSKSFNIPGISSAWTVVKSERLRPGFFAWLKASEFDTPPSCALAATMAAYNLCDEWLDAVLAYISDNIKYASEYIEREIPGARSIACEAGFGLWIDFNGLSYDAAEMRRRLIEKGGIAVSDGASFGTEGSGYIRLNVGTPRSILAEGLERIKAALK